MYRLNYTAGFKESDIFLRIFLFEISRRDRPDNAISSSSMDESARDLNGRHEFMTRGSRRKNSVSWSTKRRPYWAAPSSIGVKRAKERSHAAIWLGTMRFIEISIHREEPEMSAYTRSASAWPS